MVQAAGVALGFLMAGSLCRAQMMDNRTQEMSCQNGGFDGKPAPWCNMREDTARAAGALTVDAGRNGRIDLKGWLRDDVLIRSRIEGWGNDEGDASRIAQQVRIECVQGQIRAVGPGPVNNAWWTVSYEIFAPQSTNLILKTNNGGVSISDIRGQIRFNMNNGAVKLTRVAGDVSGSTVNGNIQLELAGNTWEGSALDVATKHGGITAAVPPNYSAHIHAATNAGSVRSEFVASNDANARTRVVDFQPASSGPDIRLTTGNGDITLKRAER
jgi:DUF4097 and DUF4098 domain-containing protein YvlB